MDNKFKGMTVIERLAVANLLDVFDNAIKEKNIEKISSILHQVELTEESIKMILSNYGLSNNKK